MERLLPLYWRLNKRKTTAGLQRDDLTHLEGIHRQWKSNSTESVVGSSVEDDGYCKGLFWCFLFSVFRYIRHLSFLRSLITLSFIPVFNTTAPLSLTPNLPTYQPTTSQVSCSSQYSSSLFFSLPSTTLPTVATGSDTGITASQITPIAPKFVTFNKILGSKALCLCTLK